MFFCTVIAEFNFEFHWMFFCTVIAESVIVSTLSVTGSFSVL